MPLTVSQLFGQGRVAVGMRGRLARFIEVLHSPCERDVDNAIIVAFTANCLRFWRLEDIAPDPTTSPVSYRGGGVCSSLQHDDGTAIHTVFADIKGFHGHGRVEATGGYCASARSPTRRLDLRGLGPRSAIRCDGLNYI